MALSNLGQLGWALGLDHLLPLLELILVQHLATVRQQLRLSHGPWEGAVHAPSLAGIRILHNFGTKPGKNDVTG